MIPVNHQFRMFRFKFFVKNLKKEINTIRFLNVLIFKTNFLFANVLVFRILLGGQWQTNFRFVT